MKDIKQVWDRIETWYKSNVPEDMFKFYPGASISAIHDVEKLLNVSFPSSLHDSFLVHDGFLGVAVGGYGYTLLSLHEIAEVRDNWSSQSSDAATFSWSHDWIPISSSGSGGYECVDSKSGEVLDLHVDREAKVVAEDFFQWVRQYALDLEAGKYRYDDSDEWVVSVE